MERSTIDYEQQTGLMNGSLRYSPQASTSYSERSRNNYEQHDSQLESTTVTQTYPNTGMNVPRNLAALLHVAGGDSAVLDSPYDHFPTSTAIGRVREADGGRTRESSAGSTMSLNQSGSTSTAVRKKRSASTEDAHVDTNDEGDEEDPGKPLKNTKRAAQNRAAQRAFRERKEQYVRDLERKSTMLDEAVTREREISARLLATEAQLSSFVADRQAFESARQLWAEEKSCYITRIREFEGIRGMLDESRRQLAETRENARRA